MIGYKVCRIVGDIAYSSVCHSLERKYEINKRTVQEDEDRPLFIFAKLRHAVCYLNAINCFFKYVIFKVEYVPSEKTYSLDAWHGAEAGIVFAFSNTVYAKSCVPVEVIEW